MGTTAVAVKTTAEIRTERRRTPLFGGTRLWVAALWPKHGSNLGTLIRTCDAFGAGLVVPAGAKATSDLRRGNTVGHGKVPVVRVSTQNKAVDAGVEYLQRSQQAGRRVVGIELAHGSQPLHNFVHDGRVTVLVLGHESYGIDPAAWPYIDEWAEIPQVGVGNCLNVAVAGSLALYQFAPTCP